MNDRVVAIDQAFLDLDIRMVHDLITIMSLYSEPIVFDYAKTILVHGHGSRVEYKYYRDVVRAWIMTDDGKVTLTKECCPIYLVYSIPVVQLIAGWTVYSNGGAGISNRPDFTENSEFRFHMENKHKSMSFKFCPDRKLVLRWNNDEHMWMEWLDVKEDAEIWYPCIRIIGGTGNRSETVSIEIND